jgi:MerR family transcriptional regulator, copper efflux regulator
LQLWGDQERSSADVKALTSRHQGARGKIAALKEMRDTLRHLVHECDGDHRPDCPIIGSLEGTVPLPESHHHQQHKPAENFGHVH